MPTDPPLIISSDQPFQVQATPSKMGGVDALAKRPLDMSGQAQHTLDHREPISADAPLPDTWVTLPTSGHEGLGGDGPVLQEQIDTSHREYFDDPSRYLRTDAMVRLPGAEAARGDDPQRVLADDAKNNEVVDVKAPPMPAQAGTAPGAPRPPSARNARRATRAARGDQRAGGASPETRERATGTPQQRSDVFHQRLVNILSHQEKIREELSAVEQAVQSTRAGLESPSAHDTHGKT